MAHFLLLSCQILAIIFKPSACHICLTNRLNLYHTVSVSKRIEFLPYFIQQIDKICRLVLCEDKVKVNYITEDDGNFTLVICYISRTFFNTVLYEFW